MDFTLLLQFYALVLQDLLAYFSSSRTIVENLVYCLLYNHEASLPDFTKGFKLPRADILFLKEP